MSGTIVKVPLDENVRRLKLPPKQAETPKKKDPKEKYIGGPTLDMPTETDDDLPSFEVLNQKLALVRDRKHLRRPLISMRTGKNAQSGLETLFFQDPLQGLKPKRVERTNPYPGMLDGHGMANAV